jgi:hypothetical protein
MKKNFFFAILGLIIVLFTVSCSKSNTTPPANTTVEGKWVGSFVIIGPSRYLALTFKTSGVLLVEAYNSATPDIANGTWSLVADSVKATYTFMGGTTDTFSIAAKYSSGSSVMNGIIGLGISATGPGVFSVTKE